MVSVNMDKYLAFENHRQTIMFLGVTNAFIFVLIICVVLLDWKQWCVGHTIEQKIDDEFNFKKF